MVSHKRAARLLGVPTVLVIASALSSAGDLYVDPGASGNESGANWANAYVRLSDALEGSQAGDRIIVAGGTYRPDRTELFPNGDGDRFATFLVEHDLTILGGFAGSANPGNPNQNNPSVYTTILSGDLEGNDRGTLNPLTINPSAAQRQDNSAHVMTIAPRGGGENEIVSVLLADLVVEGGFAREAQAPAGDPDPTIGAGLLCSSGAGAQGLAVTMERCALRGNFAKTSGGGVASLGSGLVMRDCTLESNVARFGAGYAGLGQESDDSHAHLTAVRTLFRRNHVRMLSSGAPSGGGLGLDRAITDVRNCVFVANSSSPGNSAGMGGAIYLGEGSALRASNNTFRDSRDYGGAEGATLYCDDEIGFLEFVNNICWDSLPVVGHMRYPTVQTIVNIRRFGSNNIEERLLNLPLSPWPGEDIDAAPMFADELGALMAHSPCVDAGRNQGVPCDTAQFEELDFLGRPRILDWPLSGATGFGGGCGWYNAGTQGQRPIVDIGAYEFMQDCNGNEVSDVVDILSGASDDCDGNWVPDECQPDCNGDGVPDACVPDCDSDGTPDDCEEDCDGDGVIDDCDVPGDCDNDGLPDECEPDCDLDGTPDDCEPDCDSDGTPDDCEPDCDQDGTPDDCEPDCDQDGTPDDCEPDCDSDGTPDDCEPDCDLDGTPDDCEPDCDLDGTPDDCEPDCDLDGTPDDCESDCDGDGTPDDCESDCDLDGTPDDCESDCDFDGTPDDCEPDCDGDGTPDDCELRGDCNLNGIPDNCEPDCDRDGTPDDCEPDCDGDGTPDDCEPDCNGDGTPDACEPDCNGIIDNTAWTKLRLSNSVDGLADLL